MQGAHLETEVLVVGGGSAGMAAAVGARRAGAKVLLLEELPFLGGMATAARVGTLCGLFLRNEEHAQWVHGGFVRNFAEELAAAGEHRPQRFVQGLWFLPYNYSDFAKLAEALLRREGIEVQTSVRLGGVSKAQSNIMSCSVQAQGREMSIAPQFVIDCTGAGSVSRVAGDSMLDIGQFQAGALVFELGGVQETLYPQLSRLVLREVLRACAEGKISPACERVSLIPGSLRSGRASFKISVPELCALNHAPHAELYENYSAHVRALVQHLSSFVPDLKGCYLQDIAPCLGVRSSFRGRGRALLTEEQVLSAHPLNPAPLRGAWPIEEWGLERQVRMKYLPMDASYEIPLACLRSADTTNLLFAGRTISADERALASARVIGTCLATGYAAGVLAGFESQGRDTVHAARVIQDELAC